MKVLGVLVDGGMIAFRQLTTVTSHFSESIYTTSSKAVVLLLLANDKCLRCMCTYVCMYYIHNAGQLLSLHYCGLSHYTCKCVLVWATLGVVQTQCNLIPDARPIRQWWTSEASGQAISRELSGQ